MVTTGTVIQRWGTRDHNANYFWETGSNNSFQIRVDTSGTNNGKFQLQCADASSQTAESYFYYWFGYAG